MQNSRYIIVGHTISVEFYIEKYKSKDVWLKTIQQIKNMVNLGNKTKW